MILARLKSQTASLHEEIERAVDVFRPGFGRDDYRDLLGRFLGFYEPLEDRLGRIGDPRFAAFFAPRRKAARLRADLEALGLDAGAVARLPRCDDLPACPGLDEALGIAYVTEGATLGGALVARHVAGAFGLGPGDGASFFRPYGDRTGPMWGAFRAFCNDRAGDVDAERVIAAARATFDRLGAWLERAS